MGRLISASPSRGERSALGGDPAVNSVRRPLSIDMQSAGYPKCHRDTGWYAPHQRERSGYVVGRPCHTRDLARSRAGLRTPPVRR